jgi:hypothetical protein
LAFKSLLGFEDVSEFLLVPFFQAKLDVLEFLLESVHGGASSNVYFCPRELNVVLERRVVKPKTSESKGGGLDLKIDF